MRTGTHLARVHSSATFRTTFPHCGAHPFTISHFSVIGPGGMIGLKPAYAGMTCWGGSAVGTATLLARVDVLIDEMLLPDEILMTDGKASKAGF